MNVAPFNLSWALGCTHGVLSDVPVLAGHPKLRFPHLLQINKVQALHQPKSLTWELYVSYAVKRQPYPESQYLRQQRYLFASASIDEHGGFQTSTLIDRAVLGTRKRDHRLV